MSRTASRILWAAALCVLAAALVFFNLPAKDPASGSRPPMPPAVPGSTESVESTEIVESAESVESAKKPAETAAPEADIPQGSAVGQRLPDFTLTLLSGEDFSLSQHRGRAVIINLWATWCDPCLRELPYFEELLRRHPEDAAVVAVHSGLILEDDIPGFVAALNCDLPFAVDDTGDFTALVGGSAALPHTVVVDRNGVVIYNQPGSVTYEVLEELLALAAGT